ncbi:hypothetical protein ONE63_001732 [Megalurothrips usitatus]|uniref:CRAL-TRIO domain-containing protein n=1 Tax=Megalurothrips usitatus TaxID=439358 RepID=A0AAV7X974_9NEOP|nr:hypothetical protein ONE63_001732 [Megalurothrips usitatus]
MTTRLLADLDQLSEEQELQLYKKWETTPEATRRDAVALREWLQKQPHLPKLTEDEDEWLCRYLLACKNSLERAKRRIEYFFTVQAMWPEYFTPPTVAEGLAFGEYMWGAPLPKMLPDGTRLCFYKFAPKVGKDASGMNWMMFYMLSLGYIELQLSQPGQPLHIEAVFDVEHYTLSLNNSFIAHLAEFRRFVQCIQVALPLHVRRIHVMNAPPLAVTALNKLVRPFLQDKINQRIVTHDGLDSLAKAVPVECLPKDLGGLLPLTMQEYTLRWADMAQAATKWFMDRRWMKADLTNKPDCKFNSEFGLDGSFRKLAVD